MKNWAAGDDLWNLAEKLLPPRGGDWIAQLLPDLEDEADARCCVREQLIAEVWGLVDPV